MSIGEILGWLFFLILLCYVIFQLCLCGTGLLDLFSKLSELSDLKRNSRKH